MPIADVSMTIALEGAPWVVNAIINVKMPGQDVRPALDGEVEVKLFDIEGSINRTIYYETDWIPTVGGRVPFNVTEYFWIVGYGYYPFDMNMFSLSARLAGVTPEVAVVQDILLGAEQWVQMGGALSSVRLSGSELALSIGGALIAGLALVFLGTRR